jgi:hypothetical protein
MALDLPSAISYYTFLSQGIIEGLFGPWQLQVPMDSMKNICTISKLIIIPNRNCQKFQLSAL